MPEDIAMAFGDFSSELSGILSEEDAFQIAKSLDNNSSAGLLVFEHVWAKDFKKSIVNADGVLISEGRIHPEVVNSAMEELKSK